MKRGMKNSLISYSGIIIIWKIISLFTNPLLLPPPEQVAGTLLALILSENFIGIISGTFKRAVLGLGTAVFVGVSLGIFLSPLKGYIRPVITSLQNVPLVSWVLIAIIWFGFTDRNVSFVVFVATLPIIYLNSAAGMNNIDKSLLEVADSFKLPKVLRWYGVGLPTVATHISAGISISIAITWKSVVMAELLVSRQGIGTELGISRTYLLTDTLMAWTVLLVILGLLSEYIWSLLVRKGVFQRVYRGLLPKVAALITSKPNEIDINSSLSLHNITKTYCQKDVCNLLFNNLSLRLDPGDKISLQGPSGVGKTTLLNIIAGIADPDEGEVRLNGREINYMFQEPRLFPWFTAEENITLILLKQIRYDEAKVAAMNMLDTLRIPHYLFPNQLSGGMKQAVCLARTLGAKGGVILLDEPFRSSDADQRDRMGELINHTTRPTDIIIFVTHQWEDVLSHINKTYVLVGEPALLQEKKY